MAHWVKNLPAMQETWVGKIHWKRTWQPAPVFLPRESRGQRRLVGYSPWGHKESDMTEVTEHTVGLKAVSSETSDLYYYILKSIDFQINS